MSAIFRQLPALVFLGVAFIATWKSLSFPQSQENIPGPGVFPLWLAGFLALISLALFVREFDFIKRAQTIEKTRHDKQPSNQLRLILLVCGMALYAHFMPKLGFITATTLLFFLSLRVFGYHGRLHAWSCSLAVSFILYVIFCKLMNVPLPSGWLG